LRGIKGYEKIFVSPDGEMHKIPWNAINYLYQSVQGESPLKIELITTGRDLVRREKRKAQLNKIFVVADPAFDMAPGQANKPAVDAIGNQRSGKLNNEKWGELPYTRAEGEQIAKTLSGRLIVGSQATSERVKKIQQPSILHIATHGFFYEAGQESNPMLTSGLVFAGANLKHSNGSEDAYLTALEASSMNLDKTYLVVLSACSTGDGLIKNGEGVYGLRRALKVAGASNSLLSLWKVDDAATAAFMKSFYEWIARGDSPVIALEKTQSEFTSSPIAGWRHPYYWAAWQLVSDGN
jgi:CHAT domain-containing protein